MQSFIPVIFSLTFILLFGIFIVGMIKPQAILGSTKIKMKRLFIFVAYVVSVIIIVNIAELIDPKIFETEPSPTSQTNIKSEAPELEEGVTSTEPKEEFTDSLLAKTYKENFDRLYDELMEIDNSEDAILSSREEIHKKIQNLLFDSWWNNMESIDPTRKVLPLSRKEYAICSKKYDTQYARFILYGDEDIDSIKFWAEEKGEDILKRMLVDPESLVIEKVICKGKTKKGWKCIIIYRAKNSFGGYVREQITLIMDYNEELSIYDCVEVM